jgi:hypothetical protein
MSDTIPTFPNTPSWRGVQLEAQGQLYLYLSLGIKRPGREASHSSPSSAEVKECVELYLHSPNTFSWRGVQLKAQGQLYFYLYLYLSLGVKWPGREANHSPTSSAEVIECVELYLHSPICLHGVVFS